MADDQVTYSRRHRAGVKTDLREIKADVQLVPKLLAEVEDLRAAVQCLLAEYQRDQPQQDARQ